VQKLQNDQQISQPYKPNVISLNTIYCIKIKNLLLHHLKNMQNMPLYFRL